MITGTLTTKSGTVININNNTIDAGSTYVTNQCTNGDAFQFGSVFSAEAGITLKSAIDRYSLYDAELILNFNLLLPTNEYETIPLGKFYVNEPVRVGKNISIKAYDKMILLNVDIEESTEGQPYDLLNLIGEKCGVELSQSKEEIEALTNGTKLLSLNMDMVDTYRELLSYICSVTCTFAIIDRLGKLKLCEFSTSSSYTIEPKIRTSSRFSDFISYHTSMKAFFLELGSYKGYVKKASTDDGLLYDMGEIPIVQGTPETNQIALDDIFEKLLAIRYIPCEITFNGDPSIDLGDMITCFDRSGNEYQSVVTYYKWAYRGGHTIKSAGINPKLGSVKEKKIKDLSKLEAEIKSKTIATYTYTNARAYSVKGGASLSDYKEIIRIAFAVDGTVNALFMATINFTIDYDGFIELMPLLDGLEYANGTVCQYCLAGNHVITIMNYIPCEPGKTYRFSVMARTYYEETDKRVADANIATNINARKATVTAYETLVTKMKAQTSLPFTGLADTITYEVVSPITNVPTMNIEPFNIKAAIFGQGLASEVAWDGTITFEEELPLFSALNTVGLVGIRDTVAYDIKEPIPGSITENVTLISIGEGMSLLGINAEPIVNQVVLTYTVETSKADGFTFDDKYVEHDNSFALRSEFIYESVEQEIDSGRLATLQIETSKFAAIDSLEVSET